MRWLGESWQYPCNLRSRSWGLLFDNAVCDRLMKCSPSSDTITPVEVINNRNNTENMHLHTNRERVDGLKNPLVRLDMPLSLRFLHIRGIWAGHLHGHIPAWQKQPPISYVMLDSQCISPTHLRESRQHPCICSFMMKQKLLRRLSTHSAFDTNFISCLHSAWSWKHMTSIFEHLHWHVQYLVSSSHDSGTATCCVCYLSLFLMYLKSRCVQTLSLKI